MGAMIAALFALLVQAILPAAAMAAESVGGRTIEICTSQGAQKVVIGADGKAQKKGFAGLPCQDCLGATLAVVVTPELAVAQIAYAAAEAPYVAEIAPVAPRARGPPRPFGQGPPDLNA
jgi:hypothetical protein